MGDEYTERLARKQEEEFQHYFDSYSKSRFAIDLGRATCNMLAFLYDPNSNIRISPVRAAYRIFQFLIALKGWWRSG